MIELELKPNDVMIVFRPTGTGKGDWDGNYSLLISAVGPLSLSEDDIGKLITSAMMTAACTKLLETDTVLADRAYKHCEQSFGDMEDTTTIPMNVYDSQHVLNESTPTIGGVQ